MQNTSNLAVAHKSRITARETYLACLHLPDSERYGLAAQMRRAAVSIGSNIAEGCGRHGDRSLIQFLQIAMGSASELEFQLELSVDLGLLTLANIESAIREVRGVKRMLASLINALRRAVVDADQRSKALEKAKRME